MNGLLSFLVLELFDMHFDIQCVKWEISMVGRVVYVVLIGDIDRFV